MAIKNIIEQFGKQLLADSFLLTTHSYEVMAEASPRGVGTGTTTDAGKISAGSNLPGNCV
jgi:hypothetical protein